MATDIGSIAVITNYVAFGNTYSFNLNGVPMDAHSELYASESITFRNENEAGSEGYKSGYFNLGESTGFSAPKINIECELEGYGGASINFSNSSVNFDNAYYLPDLLSVISFTGTSSINITSNSNGKTLIKASTITGTVSLNVESGVQDGDTFSIEATTNNLVITDGEWIATPSTVGNVTTYTLTKAGPSKKFRLFYTVDGGNRTLRLLGGIV